MTLTLDIPEDLERRLQQTARQQGLPADEYIVRLLDAHLDPKSSGKDLIKLLQTWIDDDDEDEQRETGDYLVRALDEDRLSQRKLFPPELKDVSW